MINAILLTIGVITFYTLLNEPTNSVNMQMMTGKVERPIDKIGLWIRDTLDIQRPTDVMKEIIWAQEVKWMQQQGIRTNDESKYDGWDDEERGY